MAQLARVSSPSLCCVKRPSFEPRSDHQLLLVHFYQFAPLFCLWVSAQAYVGSWRRPGQGKEGLSPFSL